MAFADLTLALRERRVQIAVRGMYKHDSGFNYLCLFNERQRVYTACDNVNRPRRLPLVYRQQPFVHDALSVHGFSRGPEATGLEAVAMFVATGHYVGLLPSTMPIRCRIGMRWCRCPAVRCTTTRCAPSPRPRVRPVAAWTSS